MPGKKQKYEAVGHSSLMSSSASSSDSSCSHSISSMTFSPSPKRQQKRRVRSQSCSPSLADEDHSLNSPSSHIRQQEKRRRSCSPSRAEEDHSLTSPSSQNQQQEGKGRSCSPSGDDEDHSLTSPSSQTQQQERRSRSCSPSQADEDRSFTSSRSQRRQLESSLDDEPLFNLIPSKQLPGQKDRSTPEVQPITQSSSLFKTPTPRSSQPFVESGNSAKDSVQFKSATFRRILQVVEETKVIALENKRELEFIKQMLVPQSLDFSDTLQSMSHPADQIEEFQEFCLKLEDGTFRKKVVTVLYSTGGQDVECHSRRMLDKLMSTRLMTLFNFGGKGQKAKHALNQLTLLITVMQDALRKCFKHDRNIFDKFKKSVSEYLKGAPKRLQRLTNRDASHSDAVSRGSGQGLSNRHASHSGAVSRGGGQGSTHRHASHSDDVSRGGGQSSTNRHTRHSDAVSRGGGQGLTSRDPNRCSAVKSHRNR